MKFTFQWPSIKLYCFIVVYTATFAHLHIGSGCFRARTAELSGLTETILSGPSQRNVLAPLAGTQSQMEVKLSRSDPSLVLKAHAPSQPQGGCPLAVSHECNRGYVLNEGRVQGDRPQFSLIIQEDTKENSIMPFLIDGR